MTKTICQMDEEKKAEKQTDPKYVCKKCNARANKEKHLCKPKKIKEE